MHKLFATKCLKGCFGLFFYGFGVYATIRANIGVGPLDTLKIGLADTLGLRYGIVSISVSFIMILIDFLLKENIGFGTFFDAIIVGKTVDLFNRINLIPNDLNYFVRIIIMLIGLTIMGFAQVLYMNSAIGCGPKDSLMLALGRRLKHIPIGAVNGLIALIAITLGALLRGPIGIGTIIYMVSEGALMQFAFKLTSFNATIIVHQNLVESIRMLKSEKSNKKAAL